MTGVIVGQRFKVVALKFRARVARRKYARHESAPATKVLRPGAAVPTEEVKRRVKNCERDVSGVALERDPERIRIIGGISRSRLCPDYLVKHRSFGDRGRTFGNASSACLTLEVE